MSENEEQQTPPKKKRREPELPPIDTTNFTLCGLRGEEFVMANPKRSMTKERAIVVAAYIVALCDPEGKEFARALKAVQNT